jgi:hypothetical protein
LIPFRDFQRGSVFGWGWSVLVGVIVLRR